MFRFNLHKQEQGKPIEAKTLRTIAEAAEWATRITAEPPLSIMNLAAGPLIRLAGMLFSVYIGVTNGTITARSGGTPGAGNVTVYTWNGTTLASLGIDKPVFNISSTTGGIPGSTFVIILRICASYWIITADCGNP